LQFRVDVEFRKRAFCVMLPQTAAAAASSSKQQQQQSSKQQQQQQQAAAPRVQSVGAT
jgi:hypothetical protein